MNLKHALVPVIALVALSLTAVPTDAQQRRGNGSRGSGAQAAPRASAPQQRGTPRQAQPRASAQQPRATAQQPRANAPQQRGMQNQAQPRASAPQQRGMQNQAQPRAYAQQPRASAPQQRGMQNQAQPRATTRQAVPRQGPVPRGYANDRGYAGRAPNSGYGNGYRGAPGRPVYVVPRGGYGPGYGHGYRPYYYSRPYYSFRPRVSLGFGLWIGFPITYPFYSYGYANPTYGYPLSTFGLATGVAYGGISFEVDPYDADLYVDGEYVGVVNDFGPNAQPLTLRAGMHLVEIQAAGYEPITFDVNVIPGQVIPYRGAMRFY